MQDNELLEFERESKDRLNKFFSENVEVEGIDWTSYDGFTKLITFIYDQGIELEFWRYGPIPNHEYVFTSLNIGDGNFVKIINPHKFAERLCVFMSLDTCFICGEHIRLDEIYYCNKCNDNIDAAAGAIIKKRLEKT